MVIAQGTEQPMSYSSALYQRASKLIICAEFEPVATLNTWSLLRMRSMCSAATIQQRRIILGRTRESRPTVPKAILIRGRTSR